MTKIYIDDIRPAPEGWRLIKTVSEAIGAIYYDGTRGMEITHISLDHDISIPVTVGALQRPYPSDESFGCLAYFIGMKYEGKEHPIITIHSANEKGAENMKTILGWHGITCEIKLGKPVNRLEENAT